MDTSFLDDPLYQLPKELNVPRGWGMTPEQMYAGLNSVGGMAGIVKPQVARSLAAGGVDKTALMMTALDMLRRRAPGFMRAMDRRPDIGVWLSEHLPKDVMGRAYSVDPTMLGKRLGGVGLNTGLKDTEVVPTMAHELFHHWYKSLPEAAREGVQWKTFASPNYERLLSGVSDKYPVRAIPEELSVRKLTEALLEKIAK